ncbi:TRAP transporter small permease subunit [Roseinatronobacter sp.]|uniref:TRAP transporter small permease subunit n=1 Tax=Roseinatronobacter sp. TaxID=1945755 RepID=UPI0025ED9E2D|nr:TRAP transporter small permease [Rhodobaca sp.]
MVLRIFDILRQINRVIALVVGLGLLVCVGYVLLEITLRRFGTSLGGTSEITGYVMAVTTAWGMGFALMELSHIRIEVLRTRMAGWGRVFLDLLAMLAMSATVVIIAFRAWPVLARSITNNSRANTVLETPLWIPQSLWFAGWVWFALMCCAVTFLTIILVLQGRLGDVESRIGIRNEVADELEQAK